MPLESGESANNHMCSKAGQGRAMTLSNDERGRAEVVSIEINNQVIRSIKIVWQLA